MEERVAVLSVLLEDYAEVAMHRPMHEVFAFVRANGLSISQMGTLLRLHREGPRRVSDIGDELGITSAAASQMLDRLVQQGLVERSEDPGDRRVKRIALAAAGRNLVDEGLRVRRHWFERLAAALTAGEQEQVSATLGLLIARARQLDDGLGRDGVC
jgi:DNA-binding MarR family transcriptional regulator